MADSQLGWGVKALGGVISEAAWKTKPRCSLIATEDRMIPPAAQRSMSQRGGRRHRRAEGQPRDLPV